MNLFELRIEYNAKLSIYNLLLSEFCYFLKIETHIANKHLFLFHKCSQIKSVFIKQKCRIQKSCLNPIRVSSICLNIGGLYLFKCTLFQ